MIGFKIKELVDVPGWKEIEARKIPFTDNLNCPIDGSQLFNIATVTGDDRNVRVGVCMLCGYNGYIDKPTRQWLNEFYLEKWQTDGTDFDKDVKTRKDFAKKDMFAGSVQVILKQLEKFNIDKEAEFLEIGCGYGDTLRILKKEGYKNVIGIENSTYRTKVAKEVHDIDVINEAFETIDFKKKKFDIIFSYHTLEHVYDPSEFVKRCAELQDDDGILILSMPNNIGEPTMGVLTFLPHLHSYSQISITKLLNDNGYAVIDNGMVTDRSINIIAKKVSEPQSQVKREDYYNIYTFKYMRGLSNYITTDGKDRVFWWYQTYDASGFIKVGEENFIALKKILTTGDMPIRAVLTEPLKEKKTNAPIEVQWQGNCKLFYK